MSKPADPTMSREEALNLARSKAAGKKVRRSAGLDSRYNASINIDRALKEYDQARTRVCVP